LLFHFHLHPVFRSQRDYRIRLYSMIRDKAHTPPACKRRDEQDTFHPSKAFAYAASRAAAEWKVRELRTRLARFHRPTLRIEPVRLWKEARVAVCYIRT